MGHENGGWMNDDQRRYANEKPLEAGSAGAAQSGGQHFVCETGEQAAAPQSFEEARQFHEGFLSGATAYAAAVGHSTLKRDNQQLREVFDAQGWKTIEAYERTPPMPARLEDEKTAWLVANNKHADQVIHGTFPLGMVQRWIERAGNSEQKLHDTEAQLDGLADLLADSQDLPVGATSAVSALNKIIDGVAK